LHLEEQQLQAAKHDFQQALSLAPPQHAILIASARYGLARVAVVLGELDEAYRLAHESLKTFEAQGHRQRHTVKVFLKNQILSIDSKQKPSPRRKSLDERDVSEE
jgi:tetratricopeptide (TPR) repeat protein